MMENKGCITCRKCEQVRSNFFCGRTRLSQKQLYNKHGFCSDYEPKEQIEKPMTNEEWRKTCSAEEFTEELAKVVLDLVAWNNDPKPSEVRNILKAWLQRPHREE